MTELFRSEYVTVTVADGILELRWTKQEPSDDHAVATARAVLEALDAHFGGPAGDGATLRVLVDVSAVARPYPRGSAAYARWLGENKARIRILGIIATSFLVRTALTAAVLVPGLRIKSFSDQQEARAYLDAG